MVLQQVYAEKYTRTFCVNTMETIHFLIYESNIDIKKENLEERKRMLIKYL